MACFLRCIKINILAIVGIPCLLLAFIFKLTEKLFEKFENVVTMALFSFVVFISFEIIDRIKSGTEIWKAVLLIGTPTTLTILLIVLIRNAFSIIKTVFNIIKNGITLFFETLYTAFYSVFTGISKNCERDYSRIEIESGEGVAFFICPIYDLMRLIKLIIVALINISLIVFAVLSVAIPTYVILKSRNHILETTGLGLQEYLLSLGGYERIKIIVLFSVFVMDVVVILLSLGFAWKKWANELSFDTDDEEYYREMIEDAPEDMDDAFLDENDERGQYYYDLLSEHVDDAGAFLDEIRLAIDVEENEILEDSCNQYFKELSRILKVFGKADGELSAEEFEELIPRIKKLERKKSKIEKLVDEQNEILVRPDLSSIYFSGCDTPEKLDKRYKSLCRTYHPDSESGDEDTFIAIQEEYERLKG